MRNLYTLFFGNGEKAIRSADFCKGRKAAVMVIIKSIVYFLV